MSSADSAASLSAPAAAPAPAVTVLIPAHNAGAFLREAVDSILAQTFTDFECLVIDDGSTDGAVEALRAIPDPRLRIERNPRNLGLIATLNRGLELARAPLLARMDADDVALPQRLERQVGRMSCRPRLSLIGTWAQFIDETGKSHGICRKPVDHGSILKEILHGNTFIHPSVMMRTEVARQLGGYPSEATHAEDYGLWLRMVENHESENLPECLLMYRVHSGQISQRKLAHQWRTAKALSVQARARFLARGLVSEEQTSACETTWERLKGGPGTLGAQFVQLAMLQWRMGRRGDATRIAISGLPVSPLNWSLYSLLLPEKMNPWHWWKQFRRRQ